MSAQIIIDIHHRQGATMRLASGEALEGSSIVDHLLQWREAPAATTYEFFSAAIGIEFHIITNIDARGVETTEPASDRGIMEVCHTAYTVGPSLSLGELREFLFSMAVNHIFAIQPEVDR